MRKQYGVRSQHLCALVAALAVASGAAACGGESSGSSDDVVFGYSAPVMNSGQQEIIDGMEDAASTLGWSVKVNNAQLKADKQASDLQTFLTQGVDAIALTALDPNALQSSYARVKEKQVPLIGAVTAGAEITTNVAWEIFECYDKGSSFETIQYIKERIPNPKLLVMGGPAIEILQGRVDCITKMAESAGVEIVAHEDNLNDTADAAQPIVAAALKQHPEINAIWSYNDSTALGASAALSEVGRQVWSKDHEGVVLFGANGEEGAIEAIRQGRLTATWDPQNKAIGYAMVMAARDALETEDPPRTIAIGSLLWDYQNVGEYEPNADREFTFEDLPLVDPETGESAG